MVATVLVTDLDLVLATDTTTVHRTEATVLTVAMEAGIVPAAAGGSRSKDTAHTERAFRLASQTTLG